MQLAHCRVGECDGGWQDVSFHFPCRDLRLWASAESLCVYIQHIRICEPLKFNVDVVKTLL